MKRRRAAPVLRVRISAGIDQRGDGERPKRGRREMERGISGVELMRDFLDESFPDDARLRELGRRSHQPHGFGFVGDDDVEELAKGANAQNPSLSSADGPYVAGTGSPVNRKYTPSCAR